jgi:fructokinase
MIISCGEALIDMLPRESLTGEACFAPYPGGAVFNTAIALGRLGSNSSFISGISSDLFGKTLTDALAHSKVTTDLTIVSARPTTLAFVQLTNGQAKYAFYDEATAGRMIAVEDLPAIPDITRAMFFGGISLVAEPCGSTYEHLMHSAPDHVVKMVDPNIRPSFIQDEDAYRARIDRMIAAADIVKLSDEDLVWLRGAGDIDALARQMLDEGPSLICITRGADGATGYGPSGSVAVPAQRVKVVDTVGAGDTFNAGVLAGLDRGGLLTKSAVSALAMDDIRSALEMGIAAAAVTVSRAGANPPWSSEL